MTLSLTNRFIAPTFLFIMCVSVYLFAKSCNKQPDEPIYTKLARMGTGVNVADTTKNPQQDSLQRLNTFIQKFNDTATITEFRKWMYKNASGETYDNLFNSMTPYLKYYFNSRYQDFLKLPHK